MSVSGIGVRIGLEGGKEFTDGLRGASQAVKTYVEELKKAEGLKDPFEKASTSIGTLQNAIAQQKDVIKGWRDQLDLAINKFGAFSPEAEKFRTELTKAETKLQDFENQLSKLSNASIEIKGLGTFKRDLDTMNTAVSTFAKEFEKFKNMDGLTSVFTKASGMKNSLLSEIKTQEEVVRLLAEDYEKAAREQGQFSQGALELRGKLADATRELKNMRDELKDLPNGLQLLGDEFVKLGDKVQNVGSKFTDAAKAVAPLSTAAGAGLVASAKTAASYEHNMKRVESVLSITADSAEDLANQMAAINDSIMSMDSIYSKAEIASGMEDIARAGFNGTDAMKMLTATLNVATIEEMDMSAAATGLAQAVKQFGDGADEASRYADVLASTSGASATNMTELLQAMSQAAPAANAAGAQVEDVALLLGLMANNGITASRAGTAVKNMFSNMINPTDKAADQLKKFGVSLFDLNGNLRPIPNVISEIRANFGGLADGMVNLSDEILDSEEAWQSYTQSLPVSDQERLAAIVEVFGKRALPGVLAVINTAEDKYNDLAGAINSSSGAAQNMADIIGSSTESEWKKLVNEIKALAIELGNVLLPIIKDVIAWIKEWIERFRGMDDGTKKTIVTVMALVAAVSPLLAGIGGIINGVGGIIKIGGGLVKGLGTVLGLGGKLVGVSASVVSAATGAGGVTSAIGTVGSAIGGGSAGIIGKIGSLAKAAGPFLLKGAIVTGIVAGAVWIGKKIYENWDSIKEFFGNCWNSIKDMASKIFNSIKDLLSNVWEGIKSAAKWAWEGITSVLSGAWEGIKSAASWAMEGLSNIFSGAWEAIKGAASWAWNGITSMLSGIWSGLSGLASWAIDGLGSIFSGAWEGIKNTASWAWDGISNMLGGLWNGLTGIASSALDGLCNVFSGTWSFIKNIAGGIGDVISSAASWGWDMLQEFGSGIKSGAGWVIDRVKDVGGWIADFFGFSVPDKGPLSDADTWMPDMMMLFANGIENNSWRVIDAASSMGASVKDAMSAVTEAPEKVGSSFQSIGDGIVSAAEYISGKIKSVASQAWQWGRDMSENMASGIGGGLSSITNAVKNMAGRIAEFLHFTTPDVGPLKYQDKWMPDMMKNLADGILGGIPMVKSAARQAAEAISAAHYAYLPESGARTVNTGGIGITINAQPGQDAMQIAEAVERKLIHAIERERYAYS